MVMSKVLSKTLVHKAAVPQPALGIICVTHGRSMLGCQHESWSKIVTCKILYLLLVNFGDYSIKVCHHRVILTLFSVSYRHLL